MSESIKFEADVKIRPSDDGAWSVLINGVEMAQSILADSVTITLPCGEFEIGTAHVQMTLAARLDMDVPAVMNAEFDGGNA